MCLFSCLSSGWMGLWTNYYKETIRNQFHSNQFLSWLFYHGHNWNYLSIGRCGVSGSMVYHQRSYFWRNSNGSRVYLFHHCCDIIQKYRNSYDVSISIDYHNLLCQSVEVSIINKSNMFTRTYSYRQWNSKNSLEKISIMSLANNI